MPSALLSLNICRLQSTLHHTDFRIVIVACVYKAPLLMRHPACRSCKSSAIFSGVKEEVKEAMFQYGRHLGLAFQVLSSIKTHVCDETSLHVLHIFGHVPLLPFKSGLL